MEGYQKISALVLVLVLYLCVRLGLLRLFLYENRDFQASIRPHHYSLKIRPYLLVEDGEKRFTFDGDATIEIIPNRVLNTITLNSKNLHYSLREYWSADEPKIKMKLNLVAFERQTDTVIYKLSRNLRPNKLYILHFIYTGLMGNDMAGFYRSSYIDQNNVTRWYGATQLEINHAHRVFPSIDRPDFKATFNLTIIRHKTMKSFSNTRIVNTTINGDYATDVYKTTPKMSTYIVAFIVCEFKERFNGRFGVLSRPQYYAQTEYSFNVGPKILEELNNYFNFSYYKMGIDKIHLVAIPDFLPGAMENWGLITYKESALLYENHSTILKFKQYITATIAHELSHIWFGDLITCQWWSYVWLNEGFGRYFEYFATAKVDNSFQLDQQFSIDELQNAMALDSIKQAYPLSNENTRSFHDINRMFSQITYKKGASFIRMVQHIMGAEKFQKALQEYLRKYQYKNTIPQNLFDFWKRHWPYEFKRYADSFFRSFTENVGYPVIHIDVSDDRKSFKIFQKRFLLSENDGSDASLLYTVPITYTTDKEKDFTTTKPKLFLDATRSERTVNISNEIDWIIVNIQETGYYRVNYDETSWHKIHHALSANNWSGIHELNRAQVVDDLFNLARSGVIKYELALAVLEYLETETNYLPWTSAFNGYSYLAIRLGTDTNHFSSYIRQLMEKAYKQLGFVENIFDSALDIYNRANILSWSCKYGNFECISKAKNYFQNMKTTPVPVNIRSAVYCTAMREGSETDFDTLFNKYKSETVATEQTLILNTLGCVKNTKLVEKYFNIILGEDIRHQDKSRALSGLYTENNENVSPVFKLVTDNFERVAESMGCYSAVASAISELASQFTEKSQQKDLQDFNTKYRKKFGNFASTLDAAEETVSHNFHWSKLNLHAIKVYLKKCSEPNKLCVM